MEQFSKTNSIMSSYSLLHFFNRLWRNLVIQKSMRDHYGEFGDKLLWAMKEGLLYIDSGDVPEFLCSVVIPSSHEIDCLYGLDEEGFEFPIQIMEFDHIYSFRVNDITFGFFESIKAAKSCAMEIHQAAIERHREAKRLAPKQRAPEPQYMEFWNEFHALFNPYVGGEQA